jgi:maltose O-acetyltransferase
MLTDNWTNRLIRYPGAIGSRFRVARLRMMGAHVGGNCWIRRLHVPRNPWDIAIGDFVALDDGVVLLTTGDRKFDARLHIGNGTYVNRYTMFDASLSIRIGAQCMIGPFCYITDHDHGVGPAPFANQPLVEAPVRLGNNIWIGAHAVILKGVSIGDNAIVGAGAVVTRNVESGERVIGVPGRVLRSSLEQAGGDLELPRR